jgi:hypothetical protein
MRNGNNKRMRGRNRGKGPNPLSRSYESNGPDVKVRGTAQHIAEKYLQLARDAHSSGDPVAAESYLQHAEHYFRIIAAAHEQLRQQAGIRQDGQPGVQDDDSDEGEDDDDFASLFDKRFEAPVFVRPEPQQQQQPRGEFGGQRDFQGQRDYQGQRDFQGQNRGDRFQGGQRFADRQDRPRGPADHPPSDQPDVAGAEGEAGVVPRDGQRPDGRPFESRRERFERRRAERFAERQARREAGGPQGESGPEREVMPAEPVRRADVAREEQEVSIGLPSFITGGAPAGVDRSDEPAAPRPRRRRTPRADDDTPGVEAVEKTPAAE